MTLKRTLVTDQDPWNATLTTLPLAHVLQSWQWGAFKSRHAWQVDRYLWVEDDQPRAAASVLTRRLGRLPASIMYVPKGPALDYADPTLTAHVLDDLVAIARRERAWFIKIDPDVRKDQPAGPAMIDWLTQHGWRFSPEQIQFRNTMLIDLTPDTDTLLMDMKSKWRYNVRLACRRGVTIRRGGTSDLPMLYEMYAETADRDEFVIRPQDYYIDAWQTFIDAGLAQPLIAEVEGEPVAMVIVFKFGERAWYFYGASRTMHRDKMPNHLLQWEAMQWAREQGCTVYDMWGAPDELVESDPLWGVYRFKKGFGGAFVEHIGAWDLPLARAGYWLYTRAMPRVLDVMRSLYRRGA